jgi:hypothetical protein
LWTHYARIKADFSEMPYESEKEIINIVRGFENGTILEKDWRHQEHLVVACYYAFHYDFETALSKMRNGIFNLLIAFNVDLSKEMPYHETLTVFWMRTIFDLVNQLKGASFVETTNRILEVCGDKDLPLKFYSRELLLSDKARKKFVEGDLKLN